MATTMSIEKAVLRRRLGLQALVRALLAVALGEATFNEKSSGTGRIAREDDGKWLSASLPPFEPAGLLSTWWRCASTPQSCRNDQERCVPAHGAGGRPNWVDHFGRQELWGVEYQKKKRKSE
jgi:hypothetical protein